MYKLPFKVHDGVKTRECTYEDLWFIVEFMLPYKLYSKYRKWGWLWREPIEEDVLLVFYACIKALNETSQLPHNYLHSIGFVDRSHIYVIKCKELHKWKKNRLAMLLKEFL